MSASAPLASRRDQAVRVALIGAGSIARTIATYQQSTRSFELVAVLSRALERDAVHWPAELLVGTRADLVDRDPRLVVECAGHAAVHEHVVPILEAGVDVIIASSGALADEALLARAQCARRRAQLIVPAGALPGIDGLAAAARDSLARVRLTSTKPPLGWCGTPGETTARTAVGACVLFSGNAREAARLYPRNANVAASVALAGIGFERTEVELRVDPAARCNTHRLEARGAFGSFSVEIDAAASDANARTSRLTAYSIIRAIESRAAPVVL